MLFSGNGRGRKPTEEVIFDHLYVTSFQYRPFGRTILGPAKNIKSITKAHLQQYISTHYIGPRMVVSASRIKIRRKNKARK